ncbi:tripartite tricarboxylate transporter family receptor [Roseovarius sp. A-2]|uniref:Bug family tripartite tricarboxylate transporter substrate binding protein n=1 Tax=Roseovarius sp. A-2 TaxID=1570360 RepID=UPI0009B53D2A|nr:tripartite tricarboxylate transporter substrate binding protein [Roseovarius sp. A-2]GAW33652.1 tripartite tricarboxylate transporter family receptor [Roseovarius sp. A-2]
MKLNTKIKSGFVGLLSSAVIAFGGAAHAEYPEKPVDMTVLFGGTANTIAQLLSELMSNELGQPVIPVSRTGGGGAVGYSHVMSTAPDGYNIVWNSNSISTTHHTGRVPFDHTAFTPIARISTEIPVLAANSDKGWANLADLAAAVDSMDGKLKVGISGKGSFTHLTSAALFDAMGVGDKIAYISYGSGKAPVELLAGRIDAAIQWPGQFASYVETGDLNVLAVTGNERVAVLPDVPTAQEQGVDVNISMWRGLAAPAGTPADVVAKLQSAAETAVASDQFQRAAANIGFSPAFMKAEEFSALIEKDDAFYADLLSQLGMAK